MPQIGGTSETIAADGDRAVGLVYSEGSIYWVNHFRGDIRAADVTTKVARTIGTTALDLADLVLLGDTLYAPSLNDGTVVRVLKSGGTPETIATGQTSAVAIAADDRFLYWVTRKTGGTVVRMDPSNGTLLTLADGQAQPISVAADGSYVYWATYDAGGIFRVPRDGGSVQPLAQAIKATSVAVDARGIAWTAGSSVWEARADGSQAVEIALGQVTPEDAVLDPAWIYWCNFEAGSVVRAGR
ncbi:MAG TPA: hypothetical protein VHE30_16630 [Polyangiaceae bacterium]|nr:hypothetical protein [Polyangiaceae bacterium]